MLENERQVDLTRIKSFPGKYVAQWKNLLSNRRPSDELEEIDEIDADQPRSPDRRSDFERDYDRVLFAPLFRRLAGKTQVRSFPDVDYIHNRLTHSIEVASVAGTLGNAIGGFLLSKGDINVQNITDIYWICQAAGLAHDIGNPPYGHSGEYAIQDWAQQINDSDRIFPQDPVWNDLKFFDGNAQSFRILCTHDARQKDVFSFTAAVAGALVKYPNIARSFSKSCKAGKFDVFYNAKKIFQKTWKALGLSKRQRHPLSYLVEAADDICYRVLDFEDAVVEGVMSEEKFLEIVKMCINGKESVESSLYKVRSQIIRYLISDIETCFEKNYEQIMSGRLSGDLISNLKKNTVAYKYFKHIEDIYKEIYTERNKITFECGAYSQIPKLLGKGYDFIRNAMIETKDGNYQMKEFDELNHFSQHFIVLAWKRDFYEQNRKQSFEWWMHTLLDYIVGMTDSHISLLSQKM